MKNISILFVFICSRFLCTGLLALHAPDIFCIFHCLYISASLSLSSTCALQSPSQRRIWSFGWCWRARWCAIILHCPFVLLAVMFARKLFVQLVINLGKITYLSLSMELFRPYPLLCIRLGPFSCIAITGISQGLWGAKLQIQSITLLEKTNTRWG